MELREIVSAHDPDKMRAGDAAPQMDDRIDSVPDANDSFETGDIDARIVGDFPRSFSAFAEVVQGSGILQRIARRQQPPDAIELEALQRELADGAMRRVR